MRRRWRSSRRLSGAFAAGAVIWSILAALATVRVYSAYHYEVLAHPCPWCLFTLEHWAVGYPIFGALILTGLAGPAALISAVVGRRWAELSAPADRAARRAALRALVGVVLFAALAFGPALAWRARFGVWID